VVEVAHARGILSAWRRLTSFRIALFPLSEAGLCGVPQTLHMPGREEATHNHETVSAPVTLEAHRPSCCPARRAPTPQPTATGGCRPAAENWTGLTVNRPAGFLY
jgi:hypothetical protein